MLPRHAVAHGIRRLFTLSVPDARVNCAAE
jgi:hypothetical protein